ncbi:PAS domain S-box-containing protein/diguanylate cyclase (GGDEF) domain-containing protein [Noviherbaspirillum humi]|uniref:PAS domain S-box-containing protein/diguanylate cyclase (GGDEF) domain-containing protein n=1 Tax=Noviherbaspirillum humi TaxID=1688639 RepID=A0A239I7T4_9BURK|nr:EAL domain-containing protein [Noviherbaspirillum humi]SNS89113.1 PAS domain S-box-containing protein/diguanylate cyclase (GGDEF) domain-containing protein [Noviherbaspirillum humi]
MPSWAAFPRINLNVFAKRREWLAVLVWPLLGALLIGLVWINAAEKRERSRREAERSVRSEAVAVADSYSQQLAQMIEQVDQITLRLKYHWEDPVIPVDLEKDKAHGIFPESQLLYANIFDASGNLVTSTISSRHSVNVSDADYFQFHRRECCAGLLISPPSPSRFLDRPIIRFTRRLNRPDGSFDGVVFVSVEPPYLVAHQESAAPGEHDFVSARLASGPLLASKVGSRSKNYPVFYKQDPLFPTPSGIAVEPAEKFHDGRARLVAWKKLGQYPLVALAGFSLQDAMAPYEAEARSLRETAIFESLAILALSLAAAWVAARLAQRRRQAEETRETYRLATDAANEGFYMIRPIRNRQGYVDDFRLDDCNNRAADLLGVTREQLLGLKASELKPAFFRDEMLALSRLALDRGFIEDELRVSPRSPLRAKWVYRRIVRSSAGLALTIRDISAAKEQEQALAELANNDTLTKLPNRHWLATFLPAAVSRAAQRPGHLALLFIDLDNFKNVNDTLGHDAGDELLVQAAHRLRNAVRASDHVVRLGGDEFVVVLDHVDVVEDVSRVAKTIVGAIAKPFALAAGTGNQVNASIGISLFPNDGQDAETLLKHADVAMYAAKAAGKGRYAYYHTHLSDSLILRLSKESALQEAVAKDEFVVHYQPRVGMSSGRITSMEALVRWQRPQHGLVYPLDFIDVAEDIGLIVPMGEMVIDKVCRQLAQWKQEGLALVPVSINVSPQQLKSGTLSAFLMACMERHGIGPALIEVELTESAVIDRSQVVTQELAALRSLGIKLMIDDFGTGYSSMAQLHRLDVDVLKVDQAFTRALSEGSEGKLLFGAIMSMASALDICVVAEGVETVEQLNVLQTLACDEIQGHVVSQAVSAGDMAQLMLKRFLLAPPRGPGRLAPV